MVGDERLLIPLPLETRQVVPDNTSFNVKTKFTIILAYHRNTYTRYTSDVLEGHCEIRDTKTLNLSRDIVSLQVLVDVSRFSPCMINLIRNRNICCRSKKCSALIG